LRKSIPYIAGLAVVLLLAVFAYESNPDRRDAGPLDPRPLRGGHERDNRAIGEIDLEKLYPGLVLRAYKGPDKIVALTFDDGPDKLYTPGVLDILKAKGVRATFFLIGSRVEEDPDVAKRIVDEGHSIGNHTYSHPKLTAASPDLPEELQKARGAMARLGISDNGFFRPPYGAAEPSLVEQAKELGYRVAMWSVDSLDWRGLSRAEVLRNVQGYVMPGSVILQHSAGGPGEDLSGSVSAVGEIIDSLTAEGYRFVTLPEMFPLTETSP
jgi:peptidoglycan/xylan/chitin deacetylase (PgdA/CDA1 family)